jgi:hypothetical protein
MIGIKAKWEPILPKVFGFLEVVGRGLYLKPIYRNLFEWPEKRAQAIEFFEKRIPFMNPISVGVVKRLLKK